MSLLAWEMSCQDGACSSAIFSFPLVSSSLPVFLTYSCKKNLVPVCARCASFFIVRVFSSKQPCFLWHILGIRKLCIQYGAVRCDASETYLWADAYNLSHALLLVQGQQRRNRMAACLLDDGPGTISAWVPGKKTSRHKHCRTQHRNQNSEYEVCLA